ncbi:DEAD/DEAH box helicase [Thiocapsa bogorovii]|uniref:DEAD/DEAH box helicase n=1 Tax=Thiocapsa bogorovii TaxID=521689 RepID=UPI001E46910D|nr:DEAD/DEAH box helicase [Thiocapsa bogorovii]UHD15070.1 DEAD/DEAH box helicase [Thiocapsa bogorovii]
MTAFDRLHPAVQHHIVNSLGWKSLRPLQEAAIGPVLAGHHALLLAPTAGGKTEAAVLPVLSRMLSEDWRGLSVIYVCPIKALINNLAERLAAYAGLFGRRVGVWHGDIPQAERARIVREPPDLLLATPESLEVVLVSRRVAHRELFRTLRVAIVDEIHAFAGDDRGWHLIALLDRLGHLTERAPQRLGLSATVGNAKELLDWLVAGSPGERQVVAPDAGPAANADVLVDFVGTIENAAVVISRLHRGEKRLVFCDSRTQVENLASGLRALGVHTFVSHSSLSVDARRLAEQAFASGENCVIVATSTLELDIDVGDLDRIIQIDAPHSVASFLQRLGRTGRRQGTRRNCLFLAIRDEAFLRALALLRLWASGYVEPVTPPPLPYQVMAQQVLALTLQEGGAERYAWADWLAGFRHATGIGVAEAQALIAYMIDEELLFEADGLLSVGSGGEAKYGLRNYLELFSVFNSPPLYAVLHGRTEIGQVHP